MYRVICRKKSVRFLPGDTVTYTPGNIANLQSQRVPTKKYKNGAVSKVYFSGIRDTIRHLKRFRVISNERLICLMLIFISKYILKVFVAKRDIGRG